MTDVTLPAIVTDSKSVVSQLAKALGIPRDAMASDDDIESAYAGLPRLLSRVPTEKRSALLARLCVAVSTGLFDSAINYAWNAAIIELRDRVRHFGLNIVAQTLARPFDEKTLIEQKDSDLLDLCLKLNLLSEEGYFFLDQCRDVRNNFSAAHPTIGNIDDHEVLVFLSRCVKHALTPDSNPRGVDPGALIAATKAGRFSPPQADKWIEALRDTHDAQRELLAGTLHGIFCDPASSEEVRLNCTDLVKGILDVVGPRSKSQLIDRHGEYLVRGDADRLTLSQSFFVRLGLIGLLSDTERHSIVARASQRLLGAHQEFNNFYNEPPFAERLDELTAQAGVPPTAAFELVCTVALCTIGNRYGVSWAAIPYYHRIIKRFGATEIAILLQATENYQPLEFRLKHYPECAARFGEILGMIQRESVPSAVLPLYDKWSARIQAQTADA